MKEIEIGRFNTLNELGYIMVEVRQHWQSIVFPHVEDLNVNYVKSRRLDKIPIEFWSEFLLNVKKCDDHVPF